MEKKGVNDQTGCKQANSLARGSNPFYLEVKLKGRVPKMLIIIPHCTVQTTTVQFYKDLN